MPAIDGGKLEVAKEEPLKRELADFVAAVREKRAPGVTGADGLRALELAQRITDAMKAGEQVRRVLGCVRCEMCGRLKFTITSSEFTS